MAERWCRLNTNWQESEWILAMSPEARLAWVQLICYAKAYGIAGVVKAKPSRVFAAQNFVSLEAAEEMLAAAEDDGALVTRDGDWVLTGWKRHQSGDETAAERQARFREKKRASASATAEPEKPSRGKAQSQPEPAVTGSNALRNATNTVTHTETTTNTGEELRASATAEPEDPWWEQESQSNPKARQIASLIASARLADGSHPFGPEQIKQVLVEPFAAELSTVDPDWSQAPAMVDQFAGSFHDHKRARSDRPVSILREKWLPILRAEVKRRPATAPPPETTPPLEPDLAEGMAAIRAFKPPSDRPAPRPQHRAAGDQPVIVIAESEEELEARKAAIKAQLMEDRA